MRQINFLVGLFVIATFFVPCARSQTVLLSQDEDENRNPTLVGYVGSIESGLTEVWRAKGGEPGWRNHLDSPHIADVDGDGQNEIIAVDRHRVLVWNPPASEPHVFETGITPSNGFSTLTIGDLADTGDVNIIAGIENTVYVLTYDGEFNLMTKARFPSLHDIRTMEVSSTSSGEGNHLFIGGWAVSGDSTFTARDQSFRHVLATDLVPKWKFENGESTITGYSLFETARVGVPFGRIHSLRVVDLNEDGFQDIVISGTDHGAETGNGRLFPAGGIATLVYDFGSDSYHDPMILENQWRYVDKAKQGEGYYKRMYESLPGSIGIGIEAMDVGDIDADGTAEIVTVSFGSYLDYELGESPRVSILRYDRGRLVFIDQHELPGGYSHFTGVSFGDLNGDGINEFVDSGRFLLRWNATNKSIISTPLPTSNSNYVVFGSFKYD